MGADGKRKLINVFTPKAQKILHARLRKNDAVGDYRAKNAISFPFVWLSRKRSKTWVRKKLLTFFV